MRHAYLYRTVFILLSLLILSSCGDSGSSGGSGAANPSYNTTTVEISKAEFAQTHVIPDAGLNWTTTTPVASLHLVGGRDALALVDIPQPNVLNPVLELWQGTTLLGKITLNPASSLPLSDDKLTPYSTTAWHANIPSAMLASGVSIKVSSSNLLTSASRNLEVGNNSEMNLKILPFYLFGANDVNTGTSYTNIKTLDAATQQSVFSTWPIAKLNAQTHPIGRVDLSNIVVAPRTDSAGTAQPAYVITSMEQQKEGWAVMSAVLDILHRLRVANGDDLTNNQYYSPIMSLKNLSTTPVKAYIGGGLGGGNAGVGDETYTGIFIHEQGHAFGLGHAGDEFAVGKYPYVGGSLKGSIWGYDAFKNEFLGTLIPPSATTYTSCKTDTKHQIDANGQCVKQDPMQSGSGDQASGYRYATFSDFNLGRMQRWFEETVSEDATSPTGYALWNKTSKTKDTYTPTTLSQGLYGLKQNFPVQRNVPVYGIALSYSYAGTAGASQIYPAMPYVGNLLQTIDPTNTTDLANINISGAPYNQYCKNYGCDYTLRITYSDGTVLYRVLQRSFRSWFAPSTAPAASASDPLNSLSFRTWAINVPAINPAGVPLTISKIELLDTPMVWTIGGATPNAATALTALQAAPVLLTR